MSSGADVESLGLQLQSQEAIGPGSAVAEQSTRTANIKHALELDLPTGTAENRPAATLPSDGENGVVCTNTGNAAESDRTGSVSPLFNTGGPWRIAGDKMEDMRVPLLDGDGNTLVDKHRQIVYQPAERDLLCDEHGRPIYDGEGKLCFDEWSDHCNDLLALTRQPVSLVAPLSADRAQLYA